MAAFLDFVASLPAALSELVSGNDYGREDCCTVPMVAS